MEYEEMYDSAIAEVRRLRGTVKGLESEIQDNEVHHTDVVRNIQDAHKSQLECISEYLKYGDCTKAKEFVESLFEVYRKRETLIKDKEQKGTEYGI